MARQSPLAFMSYVRLDDQSVNNHISELRRHLSSAVRLHTGQREFHIFQDREDIQFGQRWKDRVRDSINAATLFIPIITPGFFQSEACREELQQFVHREEYLRRQDLILPIYYVKCDELEDDELRATDPLAQVIHSHQWSIWHDLRLRRFSDPQVRRELNKVAERIKSVLPMVQKAAASPSEKVVDQSEIGRYHTITEAIQAANPGDRILVRKGVYKEALVIDRSWSS